ncbi:MAG: hypothetical protein IPK18_00835 [Sphingobacteriales bacterium]|nr:MAG: hypothetical protein IPK18_00835 [Sphingobacteriales bacterium]
MEIKEPNIEQQNQDDTLKSILKIINSLFSVIKKYFIILFIPIILAFLYSYKKSKDLTTSYTATISFSLSEDRPQINYSSNPFDKGFAFNNPVKLKEYSLTEKVGSKLLFKEYYYNGKEDFLINHFLRTFSGYNESYFGKFEDVEQLNTQQYSVFKRVLSTLKGMLTISSNEAEIYYITIRSSNENMSILLCNAFYENLIDYYIERSTKKEAYAVQFLQKRLEQLKYDLEKSEFNLAHYKDRANNLVTYKAELEEIKYKRDKQLVEKDYMETASMYENAKAKLQAITPLFQVIDAPHLPLASETESKSSIYILNIAIAVVFNIVFIAVLFFRQEFWSDIKAKLKQAQE